MSDQTITLTILALSVVMFIWNRFPVGIVALGVALALWATGVLTFDQSIAGFGNQTVILIAALFVVAESLDAAGVTTWAGGQLMTHAGNSSSRLIILVMAVTALLTALITPNGAVAALFPMVVVLAVQQGKSPSRLLMPVAFAAHAGSLLVLTGSPVNLIASNAAADATGHGFGFFSVALVGIPLLIGTMLVTVLFGAKLLPERTAKDRFRDLSDLPATLLNQYISGDELARLSINEGSPFIGVLPSTINAPAEALNLHLISAQGARGVLKHKEAVSAGDVLVLRGDREEIEAFAAAHGLSVVAGIESENATGSLIGRDFGVAEVIVVPRSGLIGESVYPGMVSASGNMVVLAIQRYGEDIGGGQTVQLNAGDSLLLQGAWNALDVGTIDPSIALVDTPDAIRRQTVPLGPKAVPALAVLGGMVILLTGGWVPASAACLIAAIAMILLKVVTVEQAHRSMSWTTLIIVAGMIPLSTAITNTGAAKMIAGHIVDAVGGGSPYILLLALFLITAVLGQMISNTATALILIPIAVSVATEMHVSPIALLMCVNVAAAASLLTPVATPANMMVMGPAGYEFGDYWKLGLPVMGVYLAVAVFLVPVFWPL